MNQTTNTLEVKNLMKSFGDNQAVNDISFTVSQGIIFGLVGRNGAGKTTTIRMMVNIYHPDSGEVLFNGKPRGADFQNAISYLPEERGLYKDMTVMDNLMFLAEIKGVSKAAAMEEAKSYLERFDLLEKANDDLESLSKGNQQKVQIIGTILPNPDIIILDEPFSGLDPVNTELLKDIILELKDKGKLIILSTHMMDIAERICDQVAIVHKSKLILNSDIGSLRNQYTQSKVSIEVDGDSDFISSLPYVNAVEEVGQKLKVELKSEQDNSLLLRELLDRKLVVHSFDTHKMSLHDIFVSLTRSEKEASMAATNQAESPEATA